MSWNLGESLDATKVTLELSSDNKTLTVKEDGTTHATLDLFRAAVGMEVLDNELFRRDSSGGGTAAWTQKKSGVQLSAEVKSTSVSGGSEQWFFMIGEGDIRNGLTITMDSVDARQIDLRHTGTALEVKPH